MSEFQQYQDTVIGKVSDGHEQLDVCVKDLEPRYQRLLFLNALLADELEARSQGRS